MKVRWEFYPWHRLGSRPLHEAVSYKHDGRNRSSDYDHEVYRVRNILRRYHSLYKDRRMWRKILTPEKLIMLKQRAGFDVETTLNTALHHISKSEKPFEPFSSVYVKPDEEFGMKYDFAFIDDFVQFPLGQERMKWLRRHDDLRSMRVSWRKMTRSHVQRLIEDMGGTLT